MPLIAAGATLGTGLSAAWLFNARKADNAAPLAAFMKVSQALTGKTALDREAGIRIFGALQASVPNFPLRIQQLAAAMDAGQADFPLAAADSAALPADPRQALASIILRGWYLGVVDGAAVIDRQALMHAAVAGVLPVRGYCGGAPGFWAENPAERQA
ncbi:hypothetical protein D9O50_03790 [Oxalobacteraceae bacterium CAVE-383]|nr:hypothetical protein D9O50_03790 [Oxalobacteraceae bacterium CAVE-383]